MDPEGGLAQHQIHHFQVICMFFAFQAAALIKTKAIGICMHIFVLMSFAACDGWK